MRVLVACESTERVKKAFMDKGHESHSCDLLPGELGLPNHHQCDIFELLKEYEGYFDLMIAHPPCTYLSRAGARWLYAGGKVNQQRYELGLKAKDFFMNLYNAPISKICIENPTPYKIFNLPNPSQAIQPYNFGDCYSKRTLLWLKDLPPLMATLIYVTHKPLLPSNTGGKKRGQSYHFTSISSKESSRTFQGIANAMAEQWG